MKYGKDNSQLIVTDKEKISQALETEGWVHTKLGHFRSNGSVVEKKGFVLYVRSRLLNEDLLTTLSQKSSNGASANPHKKGVSGMGSNYSMVTPKGDLTPSPDMIPGEMKSGSAALENDTSKAGNDPDPELPRLSSLSNYKSLRDLRANMPTLLIGCDSEWQSAPVRTDMISWQLALIADGQLHEFLFLRDDKDNLSLSEAIGIILDTLGCYTAIDERKVLKYQYCDEWKDNKPCLTVTSSVQEARQKAKYIYRRDKKDKDIGFTMELITSMSDRNADYRDRKWSYYHKFYDFTGYNKIKVSIVWHFGRVDLSSFSDCEWFFQFTSDIHGGLVSMHPVTVPARSFCHPNNPHVYPVLMSFSDTLCHAPAGKRKLKDLGHVIKVEKIEIPEKEKQDMRGLLNRNPTLFAEYASTDGVVALLYASSLYGYNNALPITMISAGAKIMKNMMFSYFGCESNEEFDRVYRGLERVKKCKLARDDKPGFIEATSLESISDEAHNVQYYASQGYHGGYNTCTEIGYFPFTTYDYDLQNAYPTAMCCVLDIEWEHPIHNEIIRRELTLSDFMADGVINPLTPFVGYISFEFPETIKYPCIPISIEGVPVYPLTSEGLNGVYTAGPYIWLALTLGATVFCHRGYVLSVKLREDGKSESKALSSVVLQLVQDRAKAKILSDKGSLEELSLKEITNGGYGKVAQNVIDKSTWSAYSQEMERLGCSAITNPVSAMMITSIVQVELIAAQNQIHEHGYMSCSVTTDGFISNCPEDLLKNLDLYGLRYYMEQARLYLTDGKDSEIWEIKHAQDDLLNITTRGNVSLHYYDKDDNGNITGNPMMVNGKPFNGVCAHNSTKSGYPSDSYEDRLWLMTQVLSRTGTVDYTKNDLTSFKDLVNGAPLSEIPRTRHIRMDFDMKRKPARNSFTTDIVTIDGVTYEIAHFDTEPFRTVEEFKHYRATKELTKVLRTDKDWELFWNKLTTRNTKSKPRNLDWSILNSCIMGHRSKDWIIPGLEGKTVAEKCEWINSHNTSGHVFKVNDWKNASRPERQVNRLPDELIEDKLKELMEADP